MIYLIHGENTVKRDKQLEAIFGDQSAEKLEPEALAAAGLPAIFSGQSLFSDQRLIVVYEASQDSALWSDLADYVARGSDNSLVFCESRLDKRTATYKAFAKHAKVVEATWPAAHESASVARWLADYASQRDLQVSQPLAKNMIQRSTRLDEKTQKPIIDQQQLATVITQLKGQGKVDSAMLDAVMPPSSYENVFQLIGHILEGDQAALDDTIGRLKLQEDPHRLVALLATQISNLAALVLADGRETSAQVAKDIGVHPFSLSSLTGPARQLNAYQVSQMVNSLAEVDVAMKTGRNPWQGLELALQKMLRELKIPA